MVGHCAQGRQPRWSAQDRAVEQRECAAHRPGWPAGGKDRRARADRHRSRRTDGARNRTAAIDRTGRDRSMNADKFAFFIQVFPFVAVIAVAGFGAWVINTWLRIKHGYPLDGAWGQAVYPKKN